MLHVSMLDEVPITCQFLNPLELIITQGRQSQDPIRKQLLGHLNLPSVDQFVTHVTRRTLHDIHLRCFIGEGNSRDLGNNKVSTEVSTRIKNDD